MKIICLQKTDIYKIALPQSCNPGFYNDTLSYVLGSEVTKKVQNIKF